jgi:hypothetical protein
MSIMTEEELLLMKVHTTVDINDETRVLRVKGGWIYIFYPKFHAHGIKSTTFVPEPKQN